jgi:hypothetical protein
MRLLDLPDDCLTTIFERIECTGREALALKHVCARFARLVPGAVTLCVDHGRRVPFDRSFILSGLSLYKGKIDLGVCGVSLSAMLDTLDAQGAPCTPHTSNISPATTSRIQVTVVVDRRSVDVDIACDYMVYVCDDGLQCRVAKVLYCVQRSALQTRVYLTFATEEHRRMTGIIMVRTKGYVLAPHTEASFTADMRSRWLLCDPTLVHTKMV